MAPGLHTHYWSLQLSIIIIGVALRLIQFLRRDSIWGDEAMLTLSIASRSFSELLRPLAYGQVAPVPFLWAERLLVQLFGVNEWALRALPLVAGCALCVAMALLARRILRPDEATVALVLTAFSQILIRYSAEAKPYGTDAFLTVVVLGAAAAVIARMDNKKSWIVLALAGTVAIVSALPSVFVCLGVAVALVTQAFRHKRVDLLPRIGLLALSWATLYSLFYLVFYRGPANAPYMRGFWEGSFLTLGSAHLLVRMKAALFEWGLAVDAGWALFGLSAVTLALVVLGAVTLWRRREEPYALLLLAPGIAPFAASVLGLYPVASRLLLFAAPLFILLMAVGTMWAAGKVNALIPPVPQRWVAALLVLPAVTTVLASLSYDRDQQLRPLVQTLKGQWLTGEPVYVFHRIAPAWLFYSTDWTSPDLEQLAWAMRISGPGGLGHENAPSRGPRPSGEGRNLVYEIDGHRVLLGTSSGIQGRPVFGQARNEPDSGWEGNEAQRIRGAASSRIWIMVGQASHDGVDLGEVLLDAARDAGARLTFQDSLLDGRLYRLEFSGLKPTGALTHPPDRGTTSRPEQNRR
jgi:hypothetical protein